MVPLAKTNTDGGLSAYKTKKQVKASKVEVQTESRHWINGAHMLDLWSKVADGEAGGDEAPMCCVIDTELVGWSVINGTMESGCLETADGCVELQGLWREGA